MGARVAYPDSVYWKLMAHAFRDAENGADTTGVFAFEDLGDVYRTIQRSAVLVDATHEITGPNRATVAIAIVRGTCQGEWCVFAAGCDEDFILDFRATMEIDEGAGAVRVTSMGGRTWWFDSAEIDYESCGSFVDAVSQVLRRPVEICARRTVMRDVSADSPYLVERIEIESAKRDWFLGRYAISIQRSWRAWVGRQRRIYGMRVHANARHGVEWWDRVASWQRCLWI